MVLEKIIEKYDITRPLTVFCSGAYIGKDKQDCYKIKRRGIYYDLGEDLYTETINHIKSSHIVTHGICSNCKDTYMKQI